MRETVLLTGVTSFLGFHLACKLKNSFRVIGSLSRSRSSYEGIEKKRLDHLEGIEYTQLDLTDLAKVKAAINEIKPHYMVHHAGYTKNYQNDLYDMERAHLINVSPMQTLITELTNNNCKGLIVTGTSMEYPAYSELAVEETELLPESKYGQSKLEQTKATMDYCKKMNLPCYVARVFNPAGQFDNPQKLLSFLIKSLQEGTEVELTSCEQVRNIHHVDFVAEAYKTLLANFSDQQIINICHSEVLPLKEILLKMTKALNVDSNLLKFGVRPMRESESLHLNGDNKKLMGIFDYQKSLDEQIAIIAKDISSELSS